MKLSTFLLSLLLSLSFVSAVDDWVLHVPSGLETANLVAKQHNLDILGEVIPETNLFHFKQSSRRVKRSLEDLSESFEANPHVASHEVQNQVLIRTKRVPVERRQSEARSTGNQLCFINTVSTDTKDSR
jgi:hypothetical protein